MKLPGDVKLCYKIMLSLVRAYNGGVSLASLEDNSWEYTLMLLDLSMKDKK